MGNIDQCAQTDRTLQVAVEIHLGELLIIFIMAMGCPALFQNFTSPDASV
jgi:hypothetical protein